MPLIRVKRVLRKVYLFIFSCNTSKLAAYGLADEDECLVLSQVTIVLLTDDSLQPTELLSHVHWLHAQDWLLTLRFYNIIHTQHDRAITRTKFDQLQCFSQVIRQQPPFSLTFP